MVSPSKSPREDLPESSAGNDAGRPKVSSSRSWMLTLPEAEYDQAAVELGLAPYRAFVGQLEEGEETGYRHWQLYLENGTPIRFTTLRGLFPKGHFEPREGTRAQAAEYVTKEETRVGPIISQGEIDVTARQGRRSDLDALHERVMEGASPAEVLRENPAALRYASHLERLAAARDEALYATQDRTVVAYYLWGAAGVGKTSYVMSLADRSDIYRVNSYKNPFDRYAGQPILVLDEFASSLPFDLLLNVLDRYPLLLPARYADRYAAFTDVWVVSNLPLREQYQGWDAVEPARRAALLRRFFAVEKMTAEGDVVPDVDGRA